MAEAGPIVYTIIAWAIFGLIIGAIARLLVPGEQPIGCLGTIIVGIIGSFIGGFLGALIFAGEITLRSPAGWIGSLIGAVILLLIYNALTSKKRS